MSACSVTVPRVEELVRALSPTQRRWLVDMIGSNGRHEAWRSGRKTAERLVELGVAEKNGLDSIVLTSLGYEVADACK